MIAADAYSSTLGLTARVAWILVLAVGANEARYAGHALGLRVPVAGARTFSSALIAAGTVVSL